jgi:predicted Zn-dependent protease
VRIFAEMTPLTRRPLARRAAVLATAALSLACASRQRLETAAAKALVSPEQSAQIGLQVQQQLDKQGVKYVDDQAITSWVKSIAAPLLEQAKKQRPDIKSWNLRVIDDPNTVNAFATGGGNVYVYTGLVLAAKDGAEVAGVLAHELGHVVLYHIERQLVDGLGLETVAALALGKDPGAVSQIVAGVTGQGLMLANSRGSEREADHYGLEHAAQAGYDPSGLVRFFERLAASEGKTPRALVLLQTHPTTPDRIAAAKEEIAREHLSGGSTGPGGLASVQDRIRARGGVKQQAGASAPGAG